MYHCIMVLGLQLQLRFPILMRQGLVQGVFSPNLTSCYHGLYLDFVHTGSEEPQGRSVRPTTNLYLNLYCTNRCELIKG